jgi:hypothetical protein
MTHQVVTVWIDWEGVQMAICTCGFYTKVQDIQEHIERHNKS